MDKKLLLILLVLSGGLSLLCCGGGVVYGLVVSTDDEETAVGASADRGTAQEPAPDKPFRWGTLEPPVGDGTVPTSTEDSLRIEYPEGDYDTLRKRYVRWLEDSGWTNADKEKKGGKDGTKDSGAEDELPEDKPKHNAIAVDFVNDDETVALTVVGIDGVDVQLDRLLPYKRRLRGSAKDVGIDPEMTAEQNVRVIETEKKPGSTMGSERVVQRFRYRRCYSVVATAPPGTMLFAYIGNENGKFISKGNNKETNNRVAVVGLCVAISSSAQLIFVSDPAGPVAYRVFSTENWMQDKMERAIARVRKRCLARCNHRRTFRHYKLCAANCRESTRIR